MVQVLNISVTVQVLNISAVCTSLNMNTDDLSLQH